MSINKKLLLGMGAMTIVALPLISVVSCSSNEDKDLGFVAKTGTELNTSIATQTTDLKDLDDANIAFLANQNDQTAEALATALGKYFTGVTKEKVLQTKGLKIDKTDNASRAGTNLTLSAGDSITIDVLGTKHSTLFVITANPSTEK